MSASASTDPWWLPQTLEGPDHVILRRLFKGPERKDLATGDVHE